MVQEASKSKSTLPLQNQMSLRVRFMLETIYDLKNNKKQQADMTDRLQALHRWLSVFTHRNSMWAVQQHGYTQQHSHIRLFIRLKENMPLTSQKLNMAQSVF